ncbi:MAG: hypothetical protein LCH93_10145 [Proteobacteria bacterium]|nr:hypothetical protein [Pseudomonadota bacterium]
MNCRMLAITLVGATILSAGTALAQQREPDGTAPVPDKVGSSDHLLPMGMGPNWTPTAEEAIVRQQIHDAGYGGVTMLERMPDGGWHAQAFKNQAYYELTLDRAGHVTQR